MKSRNLTAVFDISLDYWNNLKNRSSHSSSHAAWDLVPDSQSRIWLWKPLCAITYVFILLKMKLMCGSILSSWQWELHDCPFSPRVTFCCLQPPRIRLICFLYLLIAKTCCFLLFIYLNFISLCTLFFVPLKPFSCSCHYLTIPYGDLANFFAVDHCSDKDTDWMLCWYDLALFCLAVGMSHKYFYLFIYFCCCC